MPLNSKKEPWKDKNWLQCLGGLEFGFSTAEVLDSSLKFVLLLLDCLFLVL
jgi:hypothetical protein